MAGSTRDAALGMIRHALTDEEICDLVDKVPPQRRPLFEAWLRGERTLDGDRVGGGVDG